MKNKLIFLTKMSLKKKIVTKWFLIANIIFLIAITGLINIDNVINYFGGDFDKTTEILVIDDTKKSYDNFKNTYEESSKLIKDMKKTKIINYQKTLKTAKKEIKDTNNIIILLEQDNINFMKANIISDGEIDSIVSQLINSTINTTKYNMALNYYDIDQTKLAAIEKNVEIKHIRLDSQKDDESINNIITGIVLPILILPFFMLTLFLVQMIGAEVNEEKTTKSMEIIISNVSPKVHFTSKILAGNLFVLIQGSLLFLYTGIAILIRYILGLGSLNGEITNTVKQVLDSLSKTGALNHLGGSIFLILLLMILTFIGYSLVSGILASMTTNIEDYQQVQAPIIIISLAGYYLSFLSSLFKGSIFIKIMSFIPFISALLSPSLLLLGQITIWEMLISIFIMIITICILVKYGLKIYKVGILNYSQTGLWKKIFKAAKRK